MKSMRRRLALLMSVLMIAGSPMTAFAEGEYAPVDDTMIETVYELPEEEAAVDDVIAADVMTVTAGGSVQTMSISDFDESNTAKIDLGTDPFFPYKVIFAYGDQTEEKWFATEKDVLTVNGYNFAVKADFTGTVITRMNLRAGDKVIPVYLDEDGSAYAAAQAAMAKENADKKNAEESGEGLITDQELLDTLLSLESKSLTADLTKFTPGELMNVALSDVFKGETLVDGQNVVAMSDAYSSGISLSLYKMSDRISLLRYLDTTYASYTMYVGDGNQLNQNALKYNVSCKFSKGTEWLNVSVLQKDEAGNDENILTDESTSYSYMNNRKYASEYLYLKKAYSKDTRIKLSFASTDVTGYSYASIGVFEGLYFTAEELVAANPTNLTQVISDTGYAPADNSNNLRITVATYDAAGNLIALLPIRYSLQYASSSSDGSIDVAASLEGYNSETQNTYSVCYDNYSYYIDYGKSANLKPSLYKEYSLDENYVPYFYVYGVDSSSVKVFKGTYTSSAEAEAANALDYKKAYSESNYDKMLCSFKEPVRFTVFAIPSGSKEEKYVYIDLVAEAGERSILSNSSLVSFYSNLYSGEVDKYGDPKPITAYPVSTRYDSLGDHNYQLYFVNEDVDLSKIAISYSSDAGLKLYAEGSSTPIESGKTLLDFSKTGTLQLTASSEDKSTQKNYWVSVIKKSGTDANLKLVGLEDVNSNTKVENGVTYTTREVMLDGRHSYEHNIFIANTGEKSLEKVSATLESDTLQLDEYWTLNGKYDLSGITPFTSSYSPELNNLAVVRLVKKDGVENGTEISGKLTIKSGDTVLYVINLTGLIGNPVITTKEIPTMVKYVPFGTMIQNSNRYSWNDVSYYIYEGKLPSGVELMKNGELYGVPTEIGTFEVEIQLRSSLGYNYKVFTITVQDNTDENVDKSVDEGYNVSQKLDNLYLDTDKNASQTFVSVGLYNTFKNVFLDGKLLTPGVDYTSESGSTRITLTNQTLANVQKTESGVHTLGVEFRDPAKNELKKAAQNYYIKPENKGQTPAPTPTPAPSADPTPTPAPSADPTPTPAPSTDPTPAPAPSADPTPAPSSSSSSSSSATTTVTPVTTTYTVVSGDSLSKIAMKLYGDSKKWTEIYAANRNVIKNPNKISVGMVLTVNVSAGTSTPSNNATISSGNNVNYTVVSGDSLWKIAKKVYGNGNAWMRIYNANAAQLPNASKLHAGMVLVIPQ